MALLATTPAASQVDINKVKAAFLYNFTKFIDWPDGSFSSATSPISICVLGDDHFGGVLDKLTAGKLVGDRPLAIQYHASGSNVPSAGQCHLMFVAESEADRTDEILAETRGAVVTVGESPDFAQHGGMINLKRVDGKVKVELNMQEANGRGLKVSAKLQRIAILL